MERSKNIFCRRLSSRRHFMHEKFNKSKNKRNLSADSSLLLLSALRPRLLRIRIFGTMPIRLSTLKVRKSGLRYAMPMAIITFIIAGCVANSLVALTNASAASITLTVPSKISLDITPGPNGVFQKSSPSSINVKTDNSSGYTLSIKAKNSENSNALVNGSNKLNSISEQTSEANFKSSAKFNNTWGFLPSKFNSKDNSDFLPGPTIEEAILETTTEADNETGTDYNITLGAKVDNTMSSGNYNNNFIFSATANAPKYEPMQDWLGCSGLTQDDGSNGNSIVTTLVDNRDGNEYKVAKLKDGKCWMVENLRLGDEKLSNRTLTSDDTDITAPTYDLTAQTPVNFNANKNYDADALYIDPSHPEYGGYYSWHTATAGTGTASMSTTGENATSSICPKGWKLPTGGDSDSSDFGALVTAYGGDNSTGSTNLRATPVPGFVYSGMVWNDGNGLAYQGSNGYYWSSTVYNANSAYNLNLYSSHAHRAYSSNKYVGRSVRCVTEPKKTMQTVDQWGGDVGDDEVVEAIDERDGNTYTVSKLADGKLWMTQNLRLVNKTISSTDSDMTSDSDSYAIPSSTNIGWNNKAYTNNKVCYDNNTNYGALYTWLTATAGTGTGSMSSGEAPSSICPKGWRLPTYAEMNTLTSTYSVSQAQTSPPNFGSSSWAGLCNQGGCPSSQSIYGYWWSSTASSGDNAYNLHSSRDSFLMGGSRKGNGFSVRCVYAPPKKITDLQYMQDWNDLSEEEKTQVIDSMQDETNYTLKDKRDDNEYTIAKLNDGKVWMTQNLRLGDGKLAEKNPERTLTSDDTDITAPTYDLTAQTPVDYNANKNYDADALYIDPNHPEYGGYYSWHTATAGTGTAAMSSGNATSSICPKGWKLPTGDFSSDFYKLFMNYGGGGINGSTNLRATPVPGFVLSGVVWNDDRGLASQGSSGYYWASTVYNADSAWNLGLGSSSVSYSSTFSKYAGLSVRCVVAP